MVVKLSHIQMIKLCSKISIKLKQLEHYKVSEQKQTPRLRNMTKQPLKQNPWATYTVQHCKQRMKGHHLHLVLTKGKQLIVSICNYCNAFDLLTSKFFTAPVFKIFYNLGTGDHKRKHQYPSNETHTSELIKPFSVKDFKTIYSMNTFGMRKGFFAAYSHNLIIFLSLWGPSCEGFHNQSLFNATIDS